MSNRTLLEFNHDFSSRYERDPDGFIKLLLEQLRSAHQPEIHSALRLRYGVMVHETRHHSDPWEDHINTDGAK
jgi:hypothetical protein